MKQSNTFLQIGVMYLGLAGLTGNVNADQLFTQITHSSFGINKPVLRMDHTYGAIELFDIKDSPFIPRPDPSQSIDFFSDVSFDPYKLSLDARSSESYSTFTSRIKGRNLSSSVISTLKFTLSDISEETNFDSK
jgi:hypothetical protein